MSLVLWTCPRSRSELLTSTSAGIYPLSRSTSRRRRHRGCAHRSPVNTLRTLSASRRRKEFWLCQKMGYAGWVARWQPRRMIRKRQLDRIPEMWCTRIRSLYIYIYISTGPYIYDGAIISTGAGNVSSWKRWWPPTLGSMSARRKTEWIITYALVNKVPLDFSDAMKKERKSFWIY